MKELNVNQLENLEGGKFWGSDCYWNIDGCNATRWCDRYAFWFRYDHEIMDYQYIC